MLCAIDTFAYVGRMIKTSDKTDGGAEVVVYSGSRYRRYPDSPHLHHRSYFYSTGPRRGFLHRHIWEDHFGPIPEKHHIHHKDENTLNNDIANLECLPGGEHIALHLSERSRTPAHLARLDQIRPLTKEWHASEEGRAWHSKNAKKQWLNKKKTVKVCVCCGGEYETPFPGRSKFCGQACGARFKRRGPDRFSGDRRAHEERYVSCEECGEQIVTRVPQSRKYCGESCRYKARKRRKAKAGGF